MAAHVLNDLVIINCTSPNVDPNNECVHILTSIGRHHTTVKQVISSHIRRVYTSAFNKWFLSTFFETDTSHIIELPIRTKKRVSVKGQSLCFEFLDSYHCPGSVMVLLKGSFGTYLYTGNCRYSPKMLMNAPLRPYCNGTQRLDKLFVNAAYQQLSRNFPSREAVTRRLLAFLRKHSSDIIYICCRLLGKEDVLSRIATELDEKICLPPDKLRVMKKLGYNSSLFVTEQMQTRIRVIRMEDINLLKMRRRQESEKCVAVLLTGMEADKQKLKKYGVFIFPLSDHNSAEETSIMTSSIRSKEVIYLNVNNSSKENAPSPRTNQHKSDKSSSIEKKDDKSSSSEGSDRRIFFEIGQPNIVQINVEEKKTSNSNSLDSMSSISFRISRSSSDCESTCGVEKIITDKAENKASSGSLSIVEGSDEVNRDTAVQEKIKRSFCGSIEELTIEKWKDISAEHKKKGCEEVSAVEPTETVATGVSQATERIVEASSQANEGRLCGSVSSLEPPSAMELTGFVTCKDISVRLSLEASNKLSQKQSVKDNDDTWGSISSVEPPSGIELSETVPTGKETSAAAPSATGKGQSGQGKKASLRSKKSLWGSISSIETVSSMELTASVRKNNAIAAETAACEQVEGKEITGEKGGEINLWGSISSIEPPSAMELTGSILLRKENTTNSLLSRTRSKGNSLSVKKSSKKHKNAKQHQVSSTDLKNMEVSTSIPSGKENTPGSALSIVCDTSRRGQNTNKSKNESNKNTSWGSISSIEPPSGMELTGSIPVRKEDDDEVSSVFCQNKFTNQIKKSPRKRSRRKSSWGSTAQSGMELTGDVTAEKSHIKENNEGENVWTVGLSRGSGPKRKMSLGLRKSGHSESGKSILREKTTWEKSTTYGCPSAFSSLDSPPSTGYEERTEVSPTPESDELDRQAFEQMRELSLRSVDSMPELPTIVEAVPSVEDLPPADLWSLPSSPECPPGPSLTLMELTQCCPHSRSQPAGEQPSPPSAIPLPFQHKVYQEFHSRCPHIWPSLKPNTT